MAILNYHDMASRLACTCILIFFLRGSFCITSTEAFSPPRRSITNINVKQLYVSATNTVVSSSSPSVGNRMPINENYPGLKRVHSNPDVFVIERFLDDTSCDDLINRAREKGTSRSPVAYAGWTDDIKDLLGLAASGPVSW